MRYFATPVPPGASVAAVKLITGAALVGEIAAGAPAGPGGSFSYTVVTLFEASERLPASTA